MSANRGIAALSEDFLADATRLSAEPGFSLAVARYCQRFAGDAPAAWPLYKVFDQLQRYVLSYMLIHNYYAWRQGTGPAPTLTALQKVVASSPRQTAGFVAAMKTGGFVVAETNPADSRERWLRPGAEMVAEIGRSAQLFVRALDEVEGRDPPRWCALDDRERLGELVGRSAAFVLANGTLLHAFPRVLHFTTRDCGYLLLSAVMGAHYARVLPGAPPAIPLSLRSLAQRFQVSRAHVGNVLDEAGREGWFSVAPGGMLASLSEDLRLEFETWACWQMIHFGRLTNVE